MSKVKTLNQRLTAAEYKKIKFATFENISFENLINHLTLVDKKNLNKQINQVKAANTLALTKDERAIESLIQVLSHAELYPRLSASEALGKIGLPAVKPLIRYLGEIKETQDIEPPKEAFWDKRYYVHDPAARTLVRIGKSAVPALLEILKTGTDFIVQQAIDALGRIGDKSIIPPLLMEFDKRSDHLTTWKIVRAIGEIRDTAGIKFLISILKDKKYAVFIRWEAADGLGKIGDVNAVDELISMLNDNNEQICRTVARALGKIKDKRAIKPLEKLLANLPKNTTRKSIQFEIENALSEINSD